MPSDTPGVKTLKRIPAELRAAAEQRDALPRVFDLAEIEIRAAKEGSKSPGGIRGLAAVYDSLSLNLGGFREKIDRGAFDRAAAEDDVRALFNHDRNLVLGRSKAGAGTLRLDPSHERGLAIDIEELPNTSTARDLVELMKRGDVDQMSFGFSTVGDRWEEDDDGRIIRTLEEVRLFDVSPVTFPAYPETEVEARGLLAAIFATPELRAGKVLSARSRSLVESARDALDELLVAASDEADDEEQNSVDPAEAMTATVALAKLRLRAFEVAVPYHPIREETHRG